METSGAVGYTQRAMIETFQGTCRRFVCLVLLASATLAQIPAAKPDAEVEVRQTLARFIRAFDDLDWDTFRSFFADDAVVLYPRQFPARANGRAEYEATFRKVFEQIRNGRTAPPYMDIQPRDLLVRVEGQIAIVTFHLDDRPGMLNRRTLVLKKSAAGWKIIHLHASEVARADGTVQKEH